MLVLSDVGILCPQPLLEITRFMCWPSLLVVSCLVSGDRGGVIAKEDDRTGDVDGRRRRASGTRPHSAASHTSREHPGPPATPTHRPPRALRGAPAHRPSGPAQADGRDHVPARGFPPTPLPAKTTLVKVALPCRKTRFPFFLGRTE